MGTELPPFQAIEAEVKQMLEERTSFGLTEQVFVAASLAASTGGLEAILSVTSPSLGMNSAVLTYFDSCTVAALPD